MSIEYLDNAKNDSRQDAKNAFGDLVVWLEEKLDEADSHGRNGNREMLPILDDLEGAQEKVTRYARAADELVPPKNYTLATERLATKYLPHVFENEAMRIQAAIAEKGSEDRQVEGEMQDFKGNLEYYSKKYPDADLTKLNGMF